MEAESGSESKIFWEFVTGKKEKKRKKNKKQKKRKKKKKKQKGERELALPPHPGF